MRKLKIRRAIVNIEYEKFTERDKSLFLILLDAVTKYVLALGSASESLVDGLEWLYNKYPKLVNMKDFYKIMEMSPIRLYNFHRTGRYDIRRRNFNILSGTRKKNKSDIIKIIESVFHPDKHTNNFYVVFHLKNIQGLSTRTLFSVLNRDKKRILKHINIGDVERILGETILRLAGFKQEYEIIHKFDRPAFKLDDVNEQIAVLNFNNKYDKNVYSKKDLPGLIQEIKTVEGIIG